MTHAIISLLSIAMILAGTLALAGTSCSAMDLVSSSWQDMAESTGQMARTRISSGDREIDAQGLNVRVTLKNTGWVPVADFSRWDVIVQYYGTTTPYFIKRLAFTEGVPGDDQWRVEEIFEDAQAGKPEVFQPGILDPGEEIKIHMKLNPNVGAQTTNWVTIATSGGIGVSVYFTR